MLRAKSLVYVLSQPIEQQDTSVGRSYGNLISSIVITKGGAPVASYHSSKPTPNARADEDLVGTPEDPPAIISPYHVDRPMKTKVYSVYASAAWGEYVNGSTGDSGWMSIRTSDAIIFIEEIDNQLLYVLIANPETPLGLLQLKSSQVIKVLKSELKDFKLHE